LKINENSLSPILSADPPPSPPPAYQWESLIGFTHKHKPRILFTDFNIFRNHKRSKPCGLLIHSAQGWWWVGCQKIRQTPPVCISAGCLCTTDDPGLQFTDIFTKTNTGVYVVYFRRFLHYRLGDFNTKGENQHRHIVRQLFSHVSPDRI
jgi:hypothetical protein